MPFYQKVFKLKQVPSSKFSLVNSLVNIFAKINSPIQIFFLFPPLCPNLHETKERPTNAFKASPIGLGLPQGT